MVDSKKIQENGLDMALVCDKCLKTYICHPQTGEIDIKENNRCCEFCYSLFLDSLIEKYCTKEKTNNKKQNVFYRLKNKFLRN